MLGTHPCRKSPHHRRHRPLRRSLPNPATTSPPTCSSTATRSTPSTPPSRSVLGEKSYASLSDLPIKPDIVNVFRLPKFIPAIVDEMIELKLRNLWVQQGIINLEAAARAEANGIHVVMDRCIMVEHRHAAIR